MTEADLRLAGLARLDALGPRAPARQTLAFFLRRALTQPRTDAGGSDPGASLEAALAALAAPGPFTLTDAVTHSTALLEAGWDGDDPAVDRFMDAVTRAM